MQNLGQPGKYVMASEIAVGDWVADEKGQAFCVQSVANKGGKVSLVTKAMGFAPESHLECKPTEKVFRINSGRKK